MANCFCGADMRKATRVICNPYLASIDFMVSQSVNGPWEELSDGSGLLQFTGRPVLFSNCVTEIVGIINEYQNSTSDGLEIQFSGTVDDYRLLESAVRIQSDQGGGVGALSCRHIDVLPPADKALSIIRNDYSQIESEFREYLPGETEYRKGLTDIGDAIVKFLDTVSDAIPVCIIGNYSVGKSALINALIGDEVLPSSLNPTTAKNVKVVRSPSYAITVSHPDDTGKMRDHCLSVTAGDLLAATDEEGVEHLCEKLNCIISPQGKTEVQILRDVLVALNSGKRDPDYGDFLDSFGWNVTIELPFSSSLLDRTDSRIIFYDTPGNDNAEVDQRSHSQALKDLMGKQTNALPILVTCRDRTSGESTGEIMRLLDAYSENFASPSSLIVISKSDMLTKTELEEAVSADLRNWHGKSIVLFTTPIGALGLRKDHNHSWLDESYAERYEAWASRQQTPKRLSLPEFNDYPCGSRATFEQIGCSQDLFDTGIPSLEYEILYYIEHSSNYKKCVRGRKDLLEAIDRIKDELEGRRAKLERAKSEARERKNEKRKKLLAELNSIEVPSAAGLDRELEGIFHDQLDQYCSKLIQAMGELYDKVNKDNPIEMDDDFNRRIREHCQHALIDAVYEGKGGAKERIESRMVGIANLYAEKLHEYVDRNEPLLTEDGKRKLHEFLSQGVQPPVFDEVKSVLGDIGELFGKAAAVQHALFRLFDHGDGPKNEWVSQKRRSFEDKLRGYTDLFGAYIPGVFLTTVFTKPIEHHYSQLERWAHGYREEIESRIDSENAILSDMEADIKSLEVKVSELSRRLENISNVELELKTVLDTEKR